jgi:hypothetical protein
VAVQQRRDLGRCAATAAPSPPRMACRHRPRRLTPNYSLSLPGPLANTLPGRILITTPPRWADDAGNFDPTSGEADVNAPSCRSHSKVARRLLNRRLAAGWLAQRCAIRRSVQQ